MGALAAFGGKRKKPWRALPFKWKMLLKEWLEVLLPSNAHELCSGRLHIQCQRVFPRPQMEITSKFSSKPDLIAVLLASCHIPFFMDANLTTDLRGKMFYVDRAIGRKRGSIDIEGLRADISLDPYSDAEFTGLKGGSMMYQGMESIKCMMERGKEFILQDNRTQLILSPAVYGSVNTQTPQQCFLQCAHDDVSGYESEPDTKQAVTPTHALGIRQFESTWKM